MRPTHAGRAPASIAAELAAALDAADVDLAQAALRRPDQGRLRHGTLVVRRADGRRLAEVDPAGTLLAAYRWAATGLEAAWLRLPDRRWLRLEPRARRGPDGAWCDRLRLTSRLDEPGTALTTFEALDYARIERLPTLAEPARLPTGAGAVALNAVAGLAADQRRPALAYRGPYPGEQFFLTLLESFEYEGAPVDPLAAFVQGALAWRPAPHERVFRGGAYVQLRARIEKVVVGGRAYVRPDWQTIVRVAPRRVRDVGGEVRCSLWALGADLADHLALEPDGDIRGDLAPPDVAGPVRPLPSAAALAVAHLAAAMSAAPLGALVVAAAGEVAFEWGPVRGDLVDIDRAHIRVSSLIRERLRHLLAAAAATVERAGVGLAALTEIAHLAGDALRARAQRRFAALPPAEQRARLQAPPRADPGAARAITDGVEAIVAEALG